MANENIELVDRDYEKCPKKDMPRQIKTRKSSFGEIHSKFDKFRLNFYNKQLDKIIDKTIDDTYTDEDIERKIATRARIIAELEKRIKILSNDDVPARYVKNRAIKLRKNMMENAVRNSEGIYIAMDRKDIKEEEVSPINVDLGSISSDVNESVPEIDKDESIDLSSDAINRDSMEQIINDSFVDMENSETSVSEDDNVFVSPEVTPKEVEAYEANNDNTVFVSPEEVEEAVSNTDTVEKESDGIPNVIGVPETPEMSDNTNVTGFIDIDEPEIPSVPETPVEDVEIDSDMIREEINNALNNIKVSKSEASFVRNDKFDDDGHIRIRDTYTPMTDEEIEESQDKINSLKDISKPAVAVSPASIVLDNKVPFEDLFVPVDSIDTSIDKTPIKSDNRDMPVIVTDERESEKDLVSENEEAKYVGEDIPEFVFEDAEEKTDEKSVINEIDDTPDIVQSVSSTTYSSKLDEYNVLKQKTLELKQKIELTRKNKQEMQNSANQIAKEAEKTKEEAERVQKSLDDKVAELRQYCDGLEQDCNDTIKETTLIENDMKMNTNFIEFQQGKVDENKRIIEEIDALIKGNDEDIIKKHR